MAAVFGTGPGLISARTDVAATMQSLRQSHTARRPWLRESLTVVQLAIATTVVVSAFLLIGTMRELLHIDLGFDPEHITTFRVSPGDHGYDEAEFMKYHRDLENRVTLIPGVSHVAVTDHLPLYFPFRGKFYDPNSPGDTIVATTTAVGATFFDVTRIALNAGRTLRRDEIYSGTPPTPLIISDSLARQFFRSENPLGRTIMSPRYRAAPHQHTVVGVVANTRWDYLEQESGPLAFVPLHASYTRGDRAFYVVRSQQGTAQLTPLLRQAAAQIDPSLPISGVSPLSDQVERQLADRRLLARVLTVFAAFAVFLAGVGLYGVVAFGVAERTREFGIRVALGASGGRVLGLVLRQAGVLAGIGVVIGLACAAGFSRWLESRLYGIDPREPAIYLGAALGLGLVAVLAGFGPARRATRVDPMVALRCD
jgi:predicted permease